MCEFISWVEIQSANSKKATYLYLTDEEIFSSYGREVLRGSQGNDFLGHGAIRAYYGKDGQAFCGGVDREVCDFWNTEKLPPELALKIKNFEANWGQTFRRYFMNNDLRCFITYAPEEWKAKAWEQLLRQKPTNNDLRCLIISAPEKWKAKARAVLDRCR